jgi:hypothetical protein
MGLVGRMSRATGNLAGLAAGSSGVGSSVLPRDGASVAVVADETPYRLIPRAEASSSTVCGARRSRSSSLPLLLARNSFLRWDGGIGLLRLTRNE